MDERAHRAIGRVWLSDRPGEFLTRLTEVGNRMGGHPGERRAATLVGEALEEAGAREIAEDRFEMTRWDRGEAALRVTEPIDRAFDALALPYSPAGDVSGELVDVGRGTQEEFEEATVKGRIALVSTLSPRGYGRFVHRMEKYGYAVEQGASGFVYRNHVSGQLAPTGAVRFDEAGAIPAVGVSEESGYWLADYAERGGEVDLAIEADTEPGTGNVVHGVLGPETAEEVLVVAHLDAHDLAEGALDNGCGVAVALTAARLLDSFDLETQVRLAGVGCEEVGLLGADRLAQELDLGRIKAMVNVDGAGRYRGLRAFTHGSDRLVEVIEAVSDRSNHPITIEDRLHPYSDHWPFVKRGVPSLQLHSSGDDRGRGWGHTAADTRDKVDERNLRHHAILTALFVRELTRSDELPRLQREDVAATLREGDLEPGMRAAGIWPDSWDKADDDR